MDCYCQSFWGGLFKITTYYSYIRTHQEAMFDKFPRSNIPICIVIVIVYCIELINLLDFGCFCGTNHENRPIYKQLQHASFFVWLAVHLDLMQWAVLSFVMYYVAAYLLINKRFKISQNINFQLFVHKWFTLVLSGLVLISKCEYPLGKLNRMGGEPRMGMPGMNRIDVIALEWGHVGG